MEKSTTTIVSNYLESKCEQVFDVWLYHRYYWNWSDCISACIQNGWQYNSLRQRGSNREHEGGMFIFLFLRKRSSFLSFQSQPRRFRLNQTYICEQQKCNSSNITAYTIFSYENFFRSLIGSYEPLINASWGIISSNVSYKSAYNSI